LPLSVVVVRRDDHWHDGELRTWRDATLDGWLGFVCYAESAGLRWLRVGRRRAGAGKRSDLDGNRREEHTDISRHREGADYGKVPIVSRLLAQVDAHGKS
jgi:hypothetical protein